MLYTSSVFTFLNSNAHLSESWVIRYVPNNGYGAAQTASPQGYSPITCFILSWVSYILSNEVKSRKWHVLFFNVSITL